MSQFNPEVFLNQQQSKTLDSSFTSIPAGEYEAVVDKVEAGVTSKKGAPYLRVHFKLIGDGAETLKTQYGFRDPKINQMFMLDLDDSGSLEDGPNKNVRLGQLREILDQNRAGQPWAPRNLEGAGPVRIQTGLRADDQNPDVQYAEIKSFARIG